MSSAAGTSITGVRPCSATSRTTRATRAQGAGPREENQVVLELLADPEHLVGHVPVPHEQPTVRDPRRGAGNSASHRAGW